MKAGLSKCGARTSRKKDKVSRFGWTTRPNFFRNKISNDDIDCYGHDRTAGANNPGLNYLVGGYHRNRDPSRTRQIVGVHILALQAGELVAPAMMLVRTRRRFEEVVHSPLIPDTLGSDQVVRARLRQRHLQYPKDHQRRRSYPRVPLACACSAVEVSERAGCIGVGSNLVK